MTAALTFKLYPFTPFDYKYLSNLLYFIQQNGHFFIPMSLTREGCSIVAVERRVELSTLGVHQSESIQQPIEKSFDMHVWAQRLL